MSDITTYNATALVRLKDKYVIAIKRDNTDFSEIYDTNYFLDLYFIDNTLNIDHTLKFTPFDFNNTRFDDEEQTYFVKRNNNRFKCFKVEDLDFVVK